MAEVGVLNLTIQDNSSKAAGGLRSLANALDRVKGSVSGLNLTPLSTQLANVRQAIADQKGASSTITKIAGLFNAINKYATGFGKVKIDTQPIVNLATAVQTVDVGKLQQFSQTLADFSTGTMDKGIGGMSSAMESLASSMERVNKATQKMDIGEEMREIVRRNRGIIESTDTKGIGNNISAGIAQGMADAEFSGAANTVAEKVVSSLKASHDIHSPAGVTKPVGEQISAGIGEGMKQHDFTDAATTVADNVKSALDHAFESKGITGDRVQIEPRVVQSPKDEIKEFTSGVNDVKEASGQAAEAVDNLMEKVESQREALAKANLARLESNYQKMREIFMTGGKDEQALAKQVTGFDPEILTNSKTYADAVKMRDLFSSLTEEGKKTWSQVNELVNSLNAPIDYSKYTEIIDRVQGIGNATKSAKDSAMFLEKALKEQEKAAAELKMKVDSVVDSFGKKLDGSFENGIQDYIDHRTGVLKEGVSELNEKTSAFSVPALNEKDSMANPFQYASDEITHYRELLAGAKQDLEFWSQTYEKTQKAIKYNGATDERTNMLGNAEEGFYKAIEAIKEYESYITKLENHVRSFSSYKGIEAEFEKAISGTMADTKFKFEPIETNKNNTQGLEQISISAQKTGDAFQKTSTNTKYLSSEMIDLDNELKAKKGDFKSVEDGAKSLGERFKEVMAKAGGLGGAFKKMFPTLSGLAKRFGNLVKYRMLRAVISHISKGFTEGVQNVYQYSKAVGTSLAPAMDSASSAFALFKNSIGAAVAPLIQAFIPVINQVISVVVTVINYLNQFFALLGGQATWTRALPQTTSAFDKQKKAAGGAGKAMKDLLADWDELNIIQSQSGGGGGGGGTSAAEDYLNMFEEVNKFDNKIKDIVEYLKEHLNDILSIVGMIGAAILGWKISKAFSNVLPLLGKIGTGVTALATIGITLKLTDMFGQEFAKSGKPGWFIADALTGAVGSFLAYELTKKIAGSGAGKVTSGFTLILSGLINVKNAKSAMEDLQEGRAWALGALGSVQAGIGAGLIAGGLKLGTAFALKAGIMTGGFTLLLTAAVLIEAKRNATYRKMAMDAFRETGENGISVDDYKAALQTRFDELTKDMSIVANMGIELGDSKKKFDEALESIESFNAFITSGESLTQEQAEQFKQAWQTVFDALDDLGTVSYNTIFSGLQEAIRNGSEEIRNAAEGMKKEAVEVAKITGGARAAAKEEMNQIVQEIASGDTHRADRYMELYDIWEGSEAKEQFQNAVNGIKEQRIKFSEDADPAEEMQQFINDIQSEMVKPALELAQQQYQAEIDAIEEQKRELKMALDSGYIKEADYNKSLESLDHMATLFKNRLDEQKAEINGAVDNVYASIADQLYEGFFNLPNDTIARRKYIDDVINPIVALYKEAGQELPEKLKGIISLGEEGLESATNVKDFVESYGRKLTYQMAYDEASIHTDEMSKIINQILASEGLNMEWMDETGRARHGYEKLTAEDRNEILNALLPLFPDISAWDVMDYLNQNYGFSMEEMLAGIDFSNLKGKTFEMNGEEYEYSVQDMMDSIREGIENYNYTHADSPIELPEYDFSVEIDPSMSEPVSMPPLDSSEFTSALDAMTKYTADSVATIQRYLDALNTLTSAASFFGIPMPVFPNVEQRASGGPIRSGDLVMANENGNIEMMGRMGNQPVVANNQQIVQGISSGVAQANGDVVGELRTLTGLMQRMLRKEFVAKAVPGSGWARMNDTSNAAYSNISGNA